MKEGNTAALHADGDSNMSSDSSDTERTQQSADGVYMDVDWIPPTSDCVERFFSQAKLIRTDRRKSLLPVNFEMILFLKLNAGLWGIETVSKVVNNGIDEAAPLSDDDLAEQNQ